MKYITQTLYILLFTLLGELLQAVIPLPVPSAVYGIVLLFLSLSIGLIKEEQISDTAHFFIALIPLLFVAPVAKILQYWDVVAPKLVAICVITLVSTLLIFAVSGLVTKWCQKGKGGKDNG
ncbi:MAG: CidA/LrgA family protein [Ruminococcaceae bacterium]|nr:CidA/LrgA family protein [Oscillospiraceae bacterium]